jgi:peroxiredoxin
MHPIRLAATLAGLALASSVPAAAQEMIAAPPPPLLPGTRAPAFTTRTLTGKPLSLRDLRGQVVLLDYWATWCGPCRMATPTLQSLHQKFHRRGFSVVGMSMDQADSVAQVVPFVHAMHLTYPVTVSLVANVRAQSAYHANALPSQYLIDKKGIVRWSQAGYSENEGQKLTALIQKLLAER